LWRARCTKSMHMHMHMHMPIGMLDLLRFE